ncbi:3-oxoacyl-[acyl-carrier-protein] synthase-3 [Nocardia transvalensis]|uniref:3-oxoacyl-[acyl-carrier-protein] synthase-3 n=1 Tax=Nocardia transvalensis TaxID=37333 RepID=A0A7W9PMH3_9NOCA|nr:beta-ketoacyl-ACP synthase 3 [Nocardia transvalensis]MBB5918328.1 3-oxoacyl-[acyl-carrier-protein] synthase-3 [Nocardia transvalensis]
MTRHSRITGIGVYRPQRLVPSSEIAERLGLSEEWIVKRSGIERRGYAGPDETLLMMASEAAINALEHADVTPEQIGCVVVATTTHLSQMPSLASQVAFTVGAHNAGSFDILAACAGFPYAVALASDMVKAGTADHVLVIGAERITDILDEDDPATAFLFADGAGAAVIGACESPRIGPVVWGTDGSRAGAVGMTGYWDPALRTDPSLPWPRLGMKGWQVYRWAISELARVAREAVERAGMKLADIDAFVPHQANRLITEELVRQLELGEDTVVAEDITNTGNTSAASIPLALERLLAAGEVTSGMNALTMGFGSGLVYAGQVVEIP